MVGEKNFTYILNCEHFWRKEKNVLTDSISYWPLATLKTDASSLFKLGEFGNFFTIALAKTWRNVVLLSEVFVLSICRRKKKQKKKKNN